VKNKVTIPTAFQIRIDDVAWHKGDDERHINRPSRTGIPRMHSALDYPIINELGKAINMKISCAIVLGEWDKDNVLRGEKNVTWDPENWDRASQINMDYAEKAFDLLENSEYISYTLHGVMHGYYHNGKIVTERQFYPYEFDEKTGTYNKQHTWMSDDELRHHLDLFFKIYNSWGFKKPVKAFACGNGNYGTPTDAGNIRYAGIFKEYGLNVWENGWPTIEKGAAVIDGVPCIKAGGEENLPWNAFDVDPDYLNLFYKEGDEFCRAGYCMHWPNLLRWHPEKNMENLSKWVSYFMKQSEEFGCMISRDVDFAGSQAAYMLYAKMDFAENKCIIDLTDVDKQNVVVLKDEFYVSIKNDLVPKSCIGGTINEYESKKEFRTYKIVRNNSTKIEIIF